MDIIDVITHLTDYKTAQILADLLPVDKLELTAAVMRRMKSRTARIRYAWQMVATARNHSVMGALLLSLKENK